MTYNVFGGTLNLAQSQSIAYFMRRTSWSVNFIRISLTLLNRGICLILQCNGEKSQQVWDSATTRVCRRRHLYSPLRQFVPPRSQREIPNCPTTGHETSAVSHMWRVVGVLQCHESCRRPSITSKPHTQRRRIRYVVLVVVNYDGLSHSQAAPAVYT